MTKKTNPVVPARPPRPTAAEGGHSWVRGDGAAVCSYGCGAFDEERESDEPRTNPPHMCPNNPVYMRMVAAAQRKARSLKKPKK